MFNCLMISSWNGAKIPVRMQKKLSSKGNPIDNLIEKVFPKLNENCTSADYMRERVILSTTNGHVDAMNAIIIERFPGNEKVYYSFD